VNIESIKSSYRRYARHYDFLFGALFHPGRKQVVDALELGDGDRVLEVGVGTGLSLPMYPAGARVTGIDISPHMLELARARVTRDGLENIEDLSEMDAAEMTYENDSFDKVVAMYVISVVPDPVQVIAEMRRVCRPHGELIIVNHFHSRALLMRVFERLFRPFSRWAGFRPDLELDDLIAQARLDVVQVTETNLFGYWTILHCRVAPMLPAIISDCGSDRGIELTGKVG
jgi:phosphatidylethanolamine/phosphatidyl-N-methylethanolamine N-methyltransferase